MANSSITLTSLDFADYKASLKAFLQSQAQFKDYNFDASNLSVILDLLSYNTYLNAYYMNMVGSEMFLDTAQMRDSVVLRAKELNYLPRSFKSSYASVNIAVANVPNNPVLLTIPAGTTFTGKAGSNSYTFATRSNLVIAANTDGVYYASNVELYEGVSVVDTFVIAPSAATDVFQYTLSNPTIDTDSLKVVSIENNGANVISYVLSTTLLDLKETTPVFFLQGGDNSKYQIIFGDNVVGRRPPDGSTVIASYQVTNGQLPNGITIFSPDASIGGSNKITVQTVSSAQGGDINEDINSIRYNAPRYYATQERAVTVSDYETLLSVTYPEIETISAYGGEDVVPPQYGKVFISMKLFKFDAVPQSNITKYTNFLKTRAPLTIEPKFVEPEYTYASVTTTVKYNVNRTTLQPSDISAYVTTAVQNYTRTYLDKFKAELLYSKLVAFIDSAHASIISNQTDYKVMKKFVPTVPKAANYQINFNMPLDSNLPPHSSQHVAADTHAIQSTKFLYNGIIVNLEDDGIGNLRIVQEKADGDHYTIVGQGVGSVDYNTGLINLLGFYTPQYFGDSIRFYGKLPDTVKDTATKQNVIYEIPNDEIHVIVETVRQ